MGRVQRRHRDLPRERFLVFVNGQRDWWQS
jgi:hypothetical protein